MALSKTQSSRVQRPDTLLALKESLIQDSRIGTFEDEPRVSEFPPASDQPVSQDYHQAPSITTSGTSIRSDLKQDKSQVNTPSLDNHAAISAASSNDAVPYRTGLGDHHAASNKPSVTRRVFVTGVYGFIFITLACALTLLPSTWTEKSINATSAWYSSLTRMGSALDNALPRGHVEHQDSVSALDHASVQATVTSPMASNAPAPSAAVEPTPFIELRQQLEALVSSLAIVQGLVEQLTVRQEQMTQEIAVLRAAEQNVSQQISLIPSPSAARFRTHRKPAANGDTPAKGGRRIGG
jgi:hypothetical protein